ncbi:DUF6882 domain-containing protein [Microbacterium azadirachtae]|jgi:hypothetical protein|uniref:Uncharacterized protein n=1 Tax=Microbacterium azadirachtae TaxID=582680 RepID=A0A1I6IQS1_9MICO|nr:DUF6882 domain-containing protein [Microbacterium azadirachtae]SFR68991.1 hypothetical protein SAMN04488591_2960 [Microbacterium azadirachtae]
MTFPALAPLADRAALFAALRQDQLVAATDALGEHRWDVDLAAGTLAFTSEADPSRRIVARASLVATIAPGPRSLMWAWAHPQGGADPQIAALRDYGTTYGIAELSQPELPFPAEADADVDGWISGAAHQVGAIAEEITGRSPYYSAPVGSGTRAVFLLDAPLPALTVADAVTALPRILPELSLSDARSSVWDLARLAGWSMQWTDEAYSGAVVSDATGSATFRFDEYARIAGIESTLGQVPQG